MTNPDDKEIQKTLEEMKKRAEEFQAGGNYSSGSNHCDSPSNWKLILIIIVVVIILILSILFYMKSGSQKAQIKAPPGQQIIYPKDGPPKLAPKL